MSRRGRPAGSTTDHVPPERVVAVYDALRTEHSGGGWDPPRQVDLAAELDRRRLGGAGWSLSTLQRYLSGHLRWPDRRGGDLELLTHCCGAPDAVDRALSA